LTPLIALCGHLHSRFAGPLSLVIAFPSICDQQTQTSFHCRNAIILRNSTFAVSPTCPHPNVAVAPGTGSPSPLRSPRGSRFRIPLVAFCTRVLHLAIPHSTSTPRSNRVYIQPWATQREMEPHSRPCSSHNGTLRLPQALVLLLKSALVGPASNPVTQTDTDLAFWQSIKNSAYHLVSFVNPFVVGDSGWTSTLFVGMVKLTALCGFGSALWLWTRRNRKGKVASSTVDPQHADAVGKKPQWSSACLLDHVDPLERAMNRIELVAND